MNWQVPVVVLVVAWAVCYIALRTWRAWSGRTAGCGKGGCGCGKSSSPEKAPEGATSFIPSDQLTLRSPSSGRPA